MIAWKVTDWQKASTPFSQLLDELRGLRAPTRNLRFQTYIECVNIACNAMEKQKVDAAQQLLFWERLMDRLPPAREVGKDEECKTSNFRLQWALKSMHDHVKSSIAPVEATIFFKSFVLRSLLPTGQSALKGVYINIDHLDAETFGSQLRHFRNSMASYLLGSPEPYFSDKAPAWLKTFVADCCNEHYDVLPPSSMQTWCTQVQGPDFYERGSVAVFLEAQMPYLSSSMKESPSTYTLCEALLDSMRLITISEKQHNTFRPGLASNYSTTHRIALKTMTALYSNLSEIHLEQAEAQQLRQSAACFFEETFRSLLDRFNTETDMVVRLTIKDILSPALFYKDEYASVLKELTPATRESYHRFLVEHHVSKLSGSFDRSSVARVFRTIPPGTNQLLDYIEEFGLSIGAANTMDVAFKSIVDLFQQSQDRYPTKEDWVENLKLRALEAKPSTLDTSWYEPTL